MSPVWKVLLALALVLPVSAFVAGSLAASSADEPTRRDPIVVTPSPTSTPDPTPTPTPAGTPTPTGTPTDDRLEGITPDLGEVGDDHSGHGRGGDDDHDDDDDGDDRDDDDHSGPGGGDDD